MGSVTRKREPSPGLLSTSMRPSALDADAGVGDFEHRFAVALAELDGDGPAGVGVAQGVGQQVVDDLHDAPAVTVGARPHEMFFERDVLRVEQRNLDAMHTEALRLTRLVEDLGTLAEAQQPGLTLQKERLDLRELVRERGRVYADPASGVRSS